MVCIYCFHDSKVINSRLQKRANSVWRRRQCLACHAIWTTVERTEARLAYRVTKGSEMHDFIPEQLLISLYVALRHRKTAVSDAGALYVTVFQLIQKNQQSVVSTFEIKKAAYTVLKRFDKTAAAVYKATMS